MCSVSRPPLDLVRSSPVWSYVVSSPALSDLFWSSLFCFFLPFLFLFFIFFLPSLLPLSSFPSFLPSFLFLLLFPVFLPFLFPFFLPSLLPLSSFISFLPFFLCFLLFPSFLSSFLPLPSFPFFRYFPVDFCRFSN